MSTTFSEKLGEIIVEYDLTNVEVARNTGISTSYMSNILHGRGNPSIKFLGHLSRYNTISKPDRVLLAKLAAEDELIAGFSTIRMKVLRIKGLDKQSKAEILRLLDRK